jgi:hypothetical protein
VVLLKKINILVVVLVVILIAVVYRNINSTINPHISLRKTINLPVKGTWVANRYVFIGKSSISTSEAKKMINKKAIFDGDLVKVNGSICNKPTFKVKVVDSESYFESTLKIKPENIGIKEKQVKVITVSSNNNFFDDFIQINDNLLMKYNDGLLLFYVKYGKTSNEIVLNNIDKKHSRILLPKSQVDITSKSGLLLGLKTKDEYNGGYSYRTLWISSYYGKSQPILERNNLIVPRKSGFWEVGVIKKYEESGERDIIWDSPIMINKSNLQNYAPVIRDVKDTYTQILFVGTEFISLDNQKPKGSYFSVLPLDKLNGKNVEFSRIFIHDASNILNSSANNYLSKINKREKDSSLKNLSTNWAITRRSGRWILRGRIASGDFDISYPAQNKILTSYDDLYPSFDVIKKAIPDAVDAYTSPNRDFIVVLTDKELMIYSLNSRGIGSLQRKFSIKQGEKAVMAQWATGNYIDSWGKLFKNKAK